jgi:hypothetical protein
LFPPPSLAVPHTYLLQWRVCARAVGNNFQPLC